MLVYTLVGIAFGVAVTLLALYYQKADMPTGKRVGVYALWLIGLILVGFACDWGYAAVAEGEPQSMAMGFLVFGGIGVVCAVIGWRLGAAKKALKEEAEA